MPNLLYYGDNLDILRRYIHDESVDLIYLDPPFNSQATYNVLFAEASGNRSAAQIRAFEDTWHWDERAELTYRETVEGGPSKLADLLQSFRQFLGPNDVLAYLVMMAPRLTELHRVLKTTGSIYLHCDPTASHYLKLLMDAIFGPVNFRNEIIWRRTGAHNPQRSFGAIHDTLLFYSKSKHYYFKVIKQPYMAGHVNGRFTKDTLGRHKFTSGGNVLTGAGIRHGESGAPWRGFNPTAKNRHWAIPKFLEMQMPEGFRSLSVLAKLEALLDRSLIEIVPGSAWPTPVRFLESEDGHPLQDIWAHQPYTQGTVFGTKQGIDQDVAWLGPTNPERIGYQTQKPVGLLDRILRSSCPDGGVMLDPFCGCGTSIISAEGLKVRWIGIDITHLAISLIRKRLLDTYGADVSSYQVIGEPADVAGAYALAVQDRFQFQCWAVDRAGARTVSPDEVKGKDRGVDGLLYFFDDRSGQAKKVVLQVKSGHVSSRDVRDLVGVVDREKATIGALITLKSPTRDMVTEAVSAGFYDWAPLGGEPHRFPRIQILSIAELLEGEPLQMPPRLEATFRHAPKRHKVSSKQIALDLAAAR